MSDNQLAKIRHSIEKNGIKYLMIDFVDIYGFRKGRVWPASRLDDALKGGPSFTGGSVPGAGQGPEHPEMVARLDPATYVPMPWLPGYAHFCASLEVEGKPHPFCPRTNLQRVFKSALDKGYIFNVGLEHEHYTVTRDNDGNMTPWNPCGVDGQRMPGYNIEALIPGLPYLTATMDHLNDLGWECYQVDHEDGPGQWEIFLGYADALTTCDRGHYFRLAARNIARQKLGNDVHVTFQAKPFPNFCGSGLHHHYSLVDAKTGQNLFMDRGDTRGLGLSKLGYQFMAGVFHHVDALCAVMNPTPNCYKRLYPDKLSGSGNNWTPVTVTYGADNRTVLVRVPEPGHCEIRMPSGACNPYLTTAALFAAGLDGIERKLELKQQPSFGSALDPQDAKVLPRMLNTSLDALQQSEVVMQALGPIGPEFIKMKRDEVHDQDLNKDSYFRYI